MGMTIKYRLLQLVVLRHFIVHMIIGLWCKGFGTEYRATKARDYDWAICQLNDMPVEIWIAASSPNLLAAPAGIQLVGSQEPLQFSKKIV